MSKENEDIIDELFTGIIRNSIKINDLKKVYEIALEYPDSDFIAKNIIDYLISLKDVGACIKFSNLPHMTYSTKLENYILANATVSQLLEYVVTNPNATESKVVEYVIENELSIIEAKRIYDSVKWKNVTNKRNVFRYIQAKIKETGETTVELSNKPTETPSQEKKEVVIPRNKKHEESPVAKKLSVFLDPHKREKIKPIVFEENLYDPVIQVEDKLDFSENDSLIKIYTEIKRKADNLDYVKYLLERIEYYKDPYFAYLFEKNISNNYKSRVERIIKEQGTFREILLYCRDIEKAPIEDLTKILLSKNPTQTEIILFSSQVTISNLGTIRRLERRLQEIGTEDDLQAFYRTLKVPYMRALFERENRVQMFNPNKKIKDCTLCELIERVADDRQTYKRLINEASPTEISIIAELYQERLSSEFFTHAEEKVAKKGEANDVLHYYIFVKSRNKAMLYDAYKEKLSGLNNPTSEGM